MDIDVEPTASSSVYPEESSLTERPSTSERIASVAQPALDSSQHIQKIKELPPVFAELMRSSPVLQIGGVLASVQARGTTLSVTQIRNAWYAFKRQTAGVSVDPQPVASSMTADAVKKMTAAPIRSGPMRSKVVEAEQMPSHRVDSVNSVKDLPAVFAVLLASSPSLSVAEALTTIQARGTSLSIQQIRNAWYRYKRRVKSVKIGFANCTCRGCR